MRSRLIIPFVILSILGLGIFGVFRPTPVQAASSTTSDSSMFIPEISLGGLFGAHPQNGALLADYLQAVFVYFIWVIGVLAVIMIMWGGFKWVSAAGNAGQIKSARETITSAVIGLIIGLTSVVILNTIDPHLTKLDILNLDRVAPISLGTYDADAQCYPNISCGTGMTQVTGSTCPNWSQFNFSVPYYAEPGTIACSSTLNSIAQHICCQDNNDKTKCVDAASKDATRVDMKCQAPVVTQPLTGCTDTTACGVEKRLGPSTACVGHTCADGSICVVGANGTGGGCKSGDFSQQRTCELPGDGSVSGTAIQATVRMTAHTPCSMHVTDNGATGNDRTVYGYQNTCNTGDYCTFTPMMKTEAGECVIYQTKALSSDGTQCVHNTIPPIRP